jgi:hypothetical protein
MQYLVRKVRSLIYGETQARCTCMVYPLDFSGRHRGVGLAVFLWLWLGHMYV